MEELDREILRIFAKEMARAFKRSMDRAIINGDLLQGNGLNGKFRYFKKRMYWVSDRYGEINIWYN